MALKFAPIIDKFTRANGPLGENWKTESGAFTIKSQTVWTTTVKSFAYYSAQEFAANQEVYATCKGDAAGGHAGIVFRYNPTTKNGYALILSEVNTWQVFKITGGVLGELVHSGNAPKEWITLMIIGCQVEGTTFRPWVKYSFEASPTPLTEFTDATYNQPGYGGLYTGFLTEKLDDFAAASLFHMVKPPAKTSESGKPITNYTMKTEGTGSVTEWKLAGQPAGISINPTTGVISGTPTEGAVTKTVTVSMVGTASESTTFTWTITVPEAPVIESIPTQTTLAGAEVELQVGATDPKARPLTYTATGLPTGLTIDPSTGLISGKPSTVETKTAKVTVANPEASSHIEFEWKIVAGGTPPEVQKPNDQVNAIGSTVLLQLNATGGPVVTWSMVSKPAGLTLDAANGVISGKPTTVKGVTTYKVKAENTAGSSEKSFTWTIVAAPPPKLNAIANQSTLIGEPVNIQVVATGVETFSSSATLPAGLTIDAVTGLIHGEPETENLYSVTITGTGPGGTASVTFTWNIIKPIYGGPQFGITWVLTGPDGARAVFNDLTDPDYVGVISETSGFDSPEVRPNVENLTGVDGQAHGNFYFGGRPITLTGVIYNPESPAERNRKMTKLLRASNALRANAILEWTPEGGEPSYLELRRSQPLRISGAWVKEFQLAMLSADPNIYGSAVQVVQSTGTEFIANNQGTNKSWPVIILKGHAGNVTITKQTTGEHLTFSYNAPNSSNNAFLPTNGIPAVPVAFGDGTFLGLTLKNATVFSAGVYNQSLNVETGSTEYNTGAAAVPYNNTPSIVVTGNRVVIGFNSLNGASEFNSRLVELEPVSITGQANGAFHVIKEREFTNAEGHWINGLASDGEYLYIADGRFENHAIKRLKLEANGQIPTATAPETILALASGKAPNGLVLSGGKLYFGFQEAKNIGTCTVTGTGENLAAVTTPLRVTSLTADSTYFYWTSLTNFIARATLAGSGVNAEFAQTGLTPEAIVSSDAAPGALYWANRTSYSFSRIVKGLFDYNIEIDMRNRTITRNDEESLYRNLIVGSSWFELDTGQNPLKIDYENPAVEKVTASVQWRNAWV